MVVILERAGDKMDMMVINITVKEYVIIQLGD